MRSVLKAALVVAGLGGVFFVAPTSVKTRVAVWLRLADEASWDASSDAYVIKVAELKLEEMDGELKRMYRSSAATGERAAAAAADLTATEADLAVQFARLRAVRDRLPAAGAKFHTSADDRAQKEAAEVLAKCRDLEAKVDQRRAVRDRLAGEFEKAKGVYDESRRMRDNLRAELEDRKQRLETANARRDLNERAAVLRDMPIAPTGELAKALKQLKDRASAAEIDASFTAPEPPPAPVARAADPTDLSRQIDQVLGRAPSDRAGR